MSRDQIERDAKVINLRFAIACFQYVIAHNPDDSLSIVKRNRCQQELTKRIEQLKRKDDCD